MSDACKVVGWMNSSSEQFKKLTRFVAYLDTLHDFCGTRNKLISRADILHYVRQAFGYKNIDLIVKDVIFNVSEPLRSKLRVQMSQLYDYHPGAFNTFEQNMFDFVSTLDRYNKGGLENVIEIDIKKNVLDNRLKNISMNYVIYDTSALSYEYICNILRKNITVTMATNWDGDGNNTNVSPGCRDDKLNLTFGLEKANNELSSLDQVLISDDKILAKLNGVYTELAWNKIQQELSNTLNVKTYSIHMKHPKSIMKTFKRFLQIPESATKISTDIVGRITDVKRSGDWLQLQSMEPLATIRDHNDMVLYTVDTPLAARSLLKNRVAIVTKKNPGKDTVNVRIVGNVQQNKTITESKLKEAADYESTFKASWVVTAPARNTALGNLLRELAAIIDELISRGWTDIKIDVLDTTKLKSDMGYYVYPVDQALKQKQNEAVAFLIDMYVTIQHIIDKSADIEREWQSRFATKRTRTRRPSPIETRARKRTMRGGMGQQGFIELLARTQSMKTFFTEYMRLQSIDNKSVLIFQNLAKDITALRTYVSAIPNKYQREGQDLFATIKLKGTIDDKCAISSSVYGIMNELSSIADLIEHRDRARIISFNYGRTEIDYDRFVTVINDTYTNTRFHAASTLSYGNDVIVSIMQRGFDRSAAGMINRFLVSITKLKKGGAAHAQVNRKTNMIYASSENLNNESPLIRAFFHRHEYLSERMGLYVIPVVEYFIAILIRDMFFEKYKYTCFDDYSPCPYAPAAARSRGRVRSAPTGRSDVERTQLDAPLSASVGRRTNNSHKNYKLEH